MITDSQSEKNILKKWWFWGLALLVFFIVVGTTSSPQVKNENFQQEEKKEESIIDQSLQAEEQANPVSQEKNTSSKLSSAQEETKKAEKRTYPVVKVVDGDTINVDIDGTIATIRLVGINTPETVDPRKPVECFGKEASNKAKELLTNKKVILENDPTQGERDKYNRLLRYVWLEDGTFFNKIMISEGYAYEYTYDTPYKYQAEFKQAETEARLAKRGLWANNACSEDNQIPSIPPEIQSTIDTGSIICSSNTYNCTDFKTHAEAQQVFEFCGGIDNDIHKLDADKDGIACESLP